MPDEIDFLRALGDDLRAAAAQGATSHWRDRRLRAIVPVAFVGLVVAAVVVIPSVISGNTSHRGLVSPHSSPRPVQSGFGGPAPLAVGPELNAIAATGPSDVWAVGDRYKSGWPQPRSLLLHFNGVSWSSVPTPNIASLSGVTALTPDDAWAVSQDRRILHWDGSAWSVMTLPKAAGTQIDAISGSGPDDVWVVGSRFGARLPGHSIGSHTLTVHWDGSRWSIIPSPNPDHASNDLSGVLSLSPSNAWAVGEAGSRLTMHWDGTRWTTVPTPTLPGHHRGELQSLGTDGHGGVWALGQAGGPGYGGSLYLRWTGTRWTLVNAPGPLEQTPPASALSGSSPTDLWAVGNPCCARYVLARYARGAWHDLRIGFPSGVLQFEVTLDGVATLSPTDAWAVGLAYVSQPNTASREVVILHWDGNTWRTVSVPGVASVAPR